MTMDGRIESLQRKHADLDRQLANALKATVPDQDEIHRLKTMKLDTKDKLNGIKPDA